jgi:predicted  nucleic acid-binding Zn-ribbon protein
LFGVHKRLDAVLAENRDLAQTRDALVRENEHLRQQVTMLMGMSVAERAAEAERSRFDLQAQVAAFQADLSRVEQQAAQAREHLKAVQAETTSSTLLGHLPELPPVFVVSCWDDPSGDGAAPAPAGGLRRGDARRAGA